MELNYRLSQCGFGNIADFHGSARSLADLPEYSAAQLLSLITLLRGLVSFDGRDGTCIEPFSFTHLAEEYEKHATQVITFYITSLRDAVGLGWLAPSLLFLAQYWFHPSGACESLPRVLVLMRFRGTVEIRLAARALFGAAADRLSDDDTIGLVEYWRHECECPPKVYLRRTHSPYCSRLSSTRCRKAI